MAPAVDAYQAMRGVSFIVAVTSVAEIGDVRRFENPSQLAWNSTHRESPDSEAPKGFIRLNNLAPIVTSYSVSKPQFTCVSSSVLSMHNLTD